MNKSRNFSGAFTRLMKMHPDIAHLILDLYKRSKPPMPKDQIHRQMLTALRAKGLQHEDYPFNTTERGRRPLYLFLKNVDVNWLQASRLKYADNSAEALPAVNIGAALTTKRTVRGDIKSGRRPHEVAGNNRHHGGCYDEE